MPVRALKLTALLAILALLPARGRAAETTEVPSPPTPATVESTAPAPEVVAVAPVPVAAGVQGGAVRDSSVDELIQQARTAHQAAWTQRQAGDHAEAARIADKGLDVVEKALSGDLDAARRRDLVDLKSRLSGLRDVARHEAEESSKEKDGKDKDKDKEEQGDDGSSDPRVLNAPAVEAIRPQMNADVYRYVELFTGAGRSTFERWLKRSGRYMKLFREALSREGLPPDLVHLVFVESGFNLHARSVSAAVGPWQFLRSTGRLWGLTVNQWVDERRDPEKSTVAAARYLKHLYSIFGDWPLVLASYNAGEGTVLRAIKRQGTTNYWDLRLPKQTEEYVPQFMAVLTIVREPQKYGFDELDLDDPMNFDEIALQGSVDLRAIARLAECEYDELRTLNPAVLKHAAPGSNGVTMLRVPRGKAEVILSKLDNGEKLPAADLTVKHHVRRGETLRAIAQQYHVDAARLARANGITRARPLRRGMVLTVRSRPTAVALAQLEPGDPRRSTAYVPPRTIGLPAKLDGESNGDGRQTVTVRRGETLASIAQRTGASADDIRRWNHLTTSRVRRGMRLKIRTGDAVAVDPAVLAADSARVASFKAPKSRAGHGRSGSIRRTVVVRSGETLGSIASRNGTTIAKIRRANGLSTNRIRAGQRLRIPV